MMPDAPTPQPDAEQPDGTRPQAGQSQTGQSQAGQPQTAQPQTGTNLTPAEREARLKAAQVHDAELREALYTRKLLLAVLSTLQHKGVLTPGETDTLLMAARRATDASFTPSVAVRSEFPAPEPLPTSGWVRRDLKPPPIFDIQID